MKLIVSKRELKTVLFKQAYCQMIDTTVLPSKGHIGFKSLSPKLNVNLNGRIMIPILRINACFAYLDEKSWKGMLLKLILYQNKTTPHLANLIETKVTNNHCICC